MFWLSLSVFVVLTAAYRLWRNCTHDWDESRGNRVTIENDYFVNEDIDVLNEAIVNGGFDWDY